MTQTNGLRAALLAAALFAAPAFADPPAKPHEADKTDAKDEPAKHALFTPSAKATDGSVTVGGKPIAYQAVAGTLVVHRRAGTTWPSRRRMARTTTTIIRMPRHRCSTWPISPRVRPRKAGR